MNTGRYSKFIIAAAGAIITGLNTHYHGAPLLTAVTPALAALMVFLIPNSEGPPSTLAADIAAAVDQLLAQRFARPKPAPAAAAVPAAVPATDPAPLSAGDVGPVPS